MPEVRAIWELTRGEHGLMYGAGVLVGILVGGGDFGITAVFGFFTAFFIQAGTFALNDYCDVETDIANNRLDRPLVRGALTKEFAFIIACVSTALGILCSVVLTMLHGGLTLFLVALLLAVLGILYDIRMKELFALGNLYIAFTMAVPFIYGGLIAGDIGGGLLILSLIALFAGLGREVMKDIADMRGDEIRDVRSIARVYGIEKAKEVVTASYSLAVGLSVVPFFLHSTPYYHNPLFITMIGGTDIIFAHTLYGLWKRHVNYEQLRKETLVAIAIGLLAFICGFYAKC